MSPTTTMRGPTMRQAPLTRVSALRGVLARLALLFFLAHPGSAATFSDTKNFLLSRYPNRDVVPSALRPAVRRRPEDDAGSCLLFVTPFPVSRPSPSPVAPCLQQQLFSTSSWAGSKVLIDSQGPVGLATAITKPHSAVNRPLSPARGRPCRVVVGDFVSSLERRTESGARRRALLDFVSPAPSPVAVAATASSVDKETEEASMPMVDGAGMLSSSSAAMEQEGSSAPLGIRGGIMSAPNLGTEFWKKSTAPIFDAYDNVVSFVGSKLVTSSLNKMIGGGPREELASSLHRGREAANAMANGLRLSDLNSGSSSLRYDLVGFIDLDPFERSRRYFKRNRGKALL